MWAVPTEDACPSVCAVPTEDACPSVCAVPCVSEPPTPRVSDTPSEKPTVCDWPRVITSETPSLWALDQFCPTVSVTPWLSLTWSAVP